MKRPLAIFLTILLLGGCAAAAEDSRSSSALLTGETVSGIITKVNGNEITLDLVTLAQTSSRGEEKTPEAPQEERSPGDPQQGEQPSGGSREGRGERQTRGPDGGGRFREGTEGPRFSGGGGLADSPGEPLERDAGGL